VWTKDDSRNRGDLGAVEQEFCRDAAIRIDTGDIRKSIEGPGGQSAFQAEFI